MTAAPSMFKIVELDKDNQRQMTVAGQWAVLCAATAPSVQSSEWLVDLETFPDKDSAVKRAMDLSDNEVGNTSPNFAAPGSITVPYGIIKYIQNVKRSNLHHYTSKWASLFVANPPADPRVGVSFVGFVAYTSPTTGRTAIFHGQMFVKSLCPSEPSSKYLISFSAEGSALEKSLPMDMVKDMIAANAPAPTAIVPTTTAYVLSLTDTNLDKSDLLWQILAKLPASARVSADGSLDAHEVLSVLKSYDPGTFSAMAFTATASDPANAPVLSCCVYALDLLKPKVKAATSVAWSISDVAVIGAQLRSVMSSPAPASGLVGVLRSKAASDAQFDQFLKDSYFFTIPVSQHPMAKNQPPSFLTSALESFLGARPIVMGSTNLDIINGLVGNLDSGALSAVIFDFQNKMSALASATESERQMAANAKAMAEAFAKSMPSHSTSHDPMNVHVIVDDKNKTTSETEKREFSQLRIDADYIVNTSTASALIEKLVRLRDIDDGKYFADAIAAVTDQHVLRLIHSDLDIAKALQGGFDAIAQNVNAIRSTLERRLETAVLGSRSSTVNRSDRLVRAFRHARRGNLSKVRLLHLIDENDSGTSESPLKTLHSMDRSVACFKMGAAFSRLATVLSISFPSYNANTMFFLTNLSGKLQSYINEKVAWSALDKYYRSIIGLASKPSTRHALAQAAWSAPEFDERWLYDSSDFHDDLMLARQKAFAIAAAESARSPDPRIKKDNKIQKVSPKDPKGLKEDERIKRKNKKNQRKNLKAQPKLGSEGDDDDDDDEDGEPAKSRKSFEWADPKEELKAGGDGKYSKMPPRGSKLLLDWNKTHPQKDGKFQCWAHSNFRGGCPLANCKAAPCCDG